MVFQVFVVLSELRIFQHEMLELLFELLELAIQRVDLVDKSFVVFQEFIVSGCNHG